MTDEMAESIAHWTYQNPTSQIGVYGPLEGYVVDIRGAGVVSTDLSGDEIVAMPYTVPRAESLAGGGTGWADGFSLFYVKHVRGSGPVQIHLIVKTLGGTTLLDRTLDALPVMVDAITRTIRSGDAFGNVLAPSD